MGYTNTHHNYRVYMQTSQMTMVRKDVKFDEENAMRVSLERDLELHVKEELLVPKVEKPQIDVEQPHVEVLRAETSTQVESSREGRKCNREADTFLDDAWENVGEPSSQRRQRRSPERYTRNMALMGACVVIKPSSF